jgi:hypothetical protein
MTHALKIIRPNNSFLDFELDIVYKAESRISSIVGANLETAQYLQGLFGSAFAVLADVMGVIVKEIELSTIASRKCRAKILLDKAPNIVAEKGLGSAKNSTGNADIREAILYSDEEFCKIEEYRAHLEAAKQLITLKIQSIRDSRWEAASVAKLRAEVNKTVDMSQVTTSGTLVDNNRIFDIKEVEVQQNVQQKISTNNGIFTAKELSDDDQLQQNVQRQDTKVRTRWGSV